MALRETASSSSSFFLGIVAKWLLFGRQRVLPEQIIHPNIELLCSVQILFLPLQKERCFEQTA